MSSSTDQSVGGLAIYTYYQLKNGYDIQFASMMLVIYDIAITFEQEVELVWGSGYWNLGSAVYLINRYFVLVQSILNIVTELDPSLSPVDCKNMNVYASIWSIPIIVSLIEAILVMRVSALYGNNRFMRIALWVLLAASLITTATVSGVVSSNIAPIGSPVPSVTGCFYYDTDAAANLLAMIWIPSLIVEAMLFGLTALRTIQHVRADIKTPVLTVVLRDGCLYFFAIFALMLLNAVCYGVPQTGAYQTAFLEPELCISSVLCSRMFLNLRGVLYQQKGMDTFASETGGATALADEFPLDDMTTSGMGSTTVGSTGKSEQVEHVAQS